MKVGIYVRVSTKSQEDNTSLRNQVSRGIKYCEDNNYEYEVFEDIESATKTSRIKFDELYEKLKTKEIGAMYLSHWDRMVRNIEVLLLFQQIVKETNCILIADGIVRDIIGNENDSMNYEFSGLASHWERKQIVRRTNSGKRYKLERGSIVVGLQGIGYKTVYIGKEKQITIDEKESKLIIDLFKTFLRKDCKTYANLMRRLEGMYEKKGGLDKRINSSSIRRLLQDKKYLGIKYIKDTYNFDVKTYKINIGRIIEDELFSDVQAKIKIFDSNNNKRNKKGNYLLDNKVYCNGCGDKMWIRNVNGIKKNYIYYMCYTNSERDKRFGGVKKLKRLELGKNYGCDYINGNIINLEVLDDIIWKYLFDVLRNTSYLKSEYKRKYDGNVLLNSKQVGKLNYYKKKLLDIDDRIKLVLNKFIDGKLTNSQKDILVDGMELNRLEIIKNVNELELEVDNFSKIKNDVVMSYLEYLEVDLEREYSVNRFGDRYEFINKYISRIGVEVCDDEIKEGKKNKNFNIFINLKFELDDDDYDSISKIKNTIKQNYNLYVLNNKISQFDVLIHKTLILLKITIKLSIHSKNQVFSKITNIKIN